MKYDNFRSLLLRKLIHKKFYINLTKFGQMDGKGRVFFSHQVWGGVSFLQTLRDGV